MMMQQQMWANCMRELQKATENFPNFAAMLPGSLPYPIVGVWPSSQMIYGVANNPPSQSTETNKNEEARSSNRD